MDVMTDAYIVKLTSAFSVCTNMADAIVQITCLAPPTASQKKGIDAR